MLLPVPPRMAWPTGLSGSAFSTNTTCSRQSLVSWVWHASGVRVGQGQQGHQGCLVPGSAMLPPIRSSPHGPTSPPLFQNPSPSQISLLSLPFLPHNPPDGPARSKMARAPPISEAVSLASSSRRGQQAQGGGHPRLSWSPMGGLAQRAGSGGLASRTSQDGSLLFK